MTSPVGPKARRRYEKPPVVEAIASLKWAEPVRWSVTTPGLLYDALREAYPEEPQAHGTIQTTVEPGGNGSAPGFQLVAGPPRMRYSSDGGSRLVLASAQDFAAHGLEPYEGWESLEARLFHATELASDVLGTSGSPAVAGVGLRYINRVEIPTVPVRFEDYLTITIGFPEGFPPQIGAFLDRTTMSYDDLPLTLTLTWASVDAPEGSSAFVLDLDYLYECPSPTSVEEARAILNEVKLRESVAFEALLQDRLREMFVELA